MEPHHGFHFVTIYLRQGGCWSVGYDVLGRLPATTAADDLTPLLQSRWQPRQSTTSEVSYLREPLHRSLGSSTSVKEASRTTLTLILELAKNDSNWGYTSIRDLLSNLGHRVSRTTIANVLKVHGIEPRPAVGAVVGKVRRRQCLGGMLNYYYRDAA